jgi:preprotein translocase subunit SecF
MGRFATFGNDLYTGRNSIDFMGRRKLWYSIAIAMTGISLLALLIFRLNAGIEFRGGSEFTIAKVANNSQGPAEEAVKSIVPDSNPVAGQIGDGVRVSTEQLGDDQTLAVKQAMAKAYDVPVTDVDSNFIGPSWGGDVSNRAIQGLIVFMLIVALVISLYFRTWKMAASALIALVHDLIITVGVYSLTGFEVTPASVIGFLTILGYSLYDTVVVFDKVRENTEDVVHSTRRTFAEAANMAVNQTLVRSINTSVVALLPVASILFIGSFLLGAGTLKDISLALFVGIAAGTYSSIFIATPLLVDLRKNEPDIKAHDTKLLRRRAEEAAKAASGAKDGSRPSVLDEPDEDDLPAGQPVTAGAPVRSGRSSGGGQAGTPAARAQRQQPKRSGRSGPGGRKR